jgi:hypothetical protein
MTDPETRQMIEVLGDTLPDHMLDAPESEIAEYLCQMCALANYSVVTMNAHLFSIIARAKAKADRMPERVF